MAKPVWDPKVKRFRDPVTKGFVANPNGPPSKKKKKVATTKAKTPKPAPRMTQYVAFVRDHSGSMDWLRKPALNDYNSNLAEIRNAAGKFGVETFCLAIQFGIYDYRANQGVSIVNDITRIEYMPDLVRYDASGGTPMFDAIGLAIERLKQVPDYDDPNVSFLICTTTDGAENQSRKYDANTLSKLIKDLTATDRWTFAFRAPANNGIAQRLGIPSGNILEWETTERGLMEANQTQLGATMSYMSSRSLGMKSTQDFYQTDLSKVTAQDLKAAARDITSKVRVLRTRNMPEQIRPFVERETGETLQKGSVFYQLMKMEREVQDYKRILVRDRRTGKIFGGDGIRALLGLNVAGTVKIVPGDHANYDVFVQSNSVNRNLVPNTDVVVWLGN